MRELGRYDSALQMFVEQPRSVDMGRLKFLRWLGERGRLEHKIAGAPRGEFLFNLTSEEIARHVSIEKRSKQPAFGLSKGEALRRHLEQHGDY